MRYELSVLRAMFRLARRHEIAHVASLSDRVGGSHARLRLALRRLEASGFVQRTSESSARLTLEGLALAVASCAPISQRKPAKKRASRAA
jgi:RIO-like serine/threonine protein kinase